MNVSRLKTEPLLRNESLFSSVTEANVKVKAEGCTNDLPRARSMPATYKPWKAPTQTKYASSSALVKSPLARRRARSLTFTRRSLRPQIRAGSTTAPSERTTPGLRYPVPVGPARHTSSASSQTCTNRRQTSASRRSAAPSSSSATTTANATATEVTPVLQHYIEVLVSYRVMNEKEPRLLTKTIQRAKQNRQDQLTQIGRMSDKFLRSLEAKFGGLI